MHQNIVSSGTPHKATNKYKLVLYLRFLQGWDAGEGTKTGRLRAFSVPHETLLPGLQFTLAGIIGAPATYYEVPAIRFSYDLLAYLYVLFFPS